MRTVYSRPVIRHYMRNHVYRDPALASDDWVDYVWERVNRPGAMEAAHATLRFCHAPAAIARSVRDIRAPTLIVWGDGDKIFPAAHAERLAADIPGAERVVIAGCGHAPPEEKPDEVVRLVRAFLGGDAHARRPAAAAVSP
jgi:pimeloyl-ACP methyl ester carboxylesterase